MEIPEIHEDLALDMMRPLDDERTDFLLKLAEDISDISVKDEVTEIDREIMRIASSNILFLTAMCAAGYTLYSDYFDLAKRLRSDMNLIVEMLKVSAPHVAANINLESMRNYDEYDAMTPDKFFGGDQ